MSAMSLFDQHLDALARGWPLRNPGAFWVVNGAVGAVLLPQFGLLAAPLDDLSRIYGAPQIAIPACAGLIAAYLPIAWAKHRELVRLRPVRAGSRDAAIQVGPMRISLDDLFTSTLVTGSPGTGKTAGVVLPMILELANTFRDEGGPVDSDFQKFGGLILEVKGDLTEAVVQLMHQAGRCVSRDVAIISPVSRVPVVRFRDEKGRFWHLCGRGGTDGNDAGRIMPRLIHPVSKYDMPNDMFDRGAAFLDEIDAVLRNVTIDLGDRKPNFMGWRWEGDSLVRVTHTTGYEQVERVQVGGKDRRVDDPPQRLVFHEVLSVSNGIRYNFIDADVSGTEAAARLAKVVQMAQGDDGGGGKDPYWQNQMRKLISSCIMLHKAVETTACTAKDVLRMVTQESILDAKLDKLSKKIQVLKKKGEGYSTREAREDFALKHVAPMEDLCAFYVEEWKKMVADGKTANIIKSFVSGAFDAFLTDPNLSETFCSPSTIRFENCVQEGKVYAMVPGRDYQKTATIFGTAIKEGFQGVLLSRNQRSDLNPKRVVLQLIDEAQRHIVAGGTEAGDHYFMAQCRSNRVVCVYATQSYAWIYKAVGKDSGNVFLTCVGNQFWLQQTDPDTNKRASEICGSAHEEKRSAETNLNLFEVAGGKGGSVKQKVSMEEKARFRPEDFSLLSTSDVIIFNKGEEGRRDKVKKGKLAFGHVTSKDGKVKAAIRFREYYREFMENRMHETQKGFMLDCDPVVANSGDDNKGEIVAAATGPIGDSAAPGTTPTEPAPAYPAVTDIPVPYQSIFPLSGDHDPYVLQHDNHVQVEELLRGELSDDPDRPADVPAPEVPSPAPRDGAGDPPLPERPVGMQPVPDAHAGTSAPRALAAPASDSPPLPVIEKGGAIWRVADMPSEMPVANLTPAELERQQMAYNRLYDFPGLLRDNMEDATLADRLLQEMMELAQNRTPETIPDKAVAGAGGQLLGDTHKARPVVPVPETIEGDLLQKLEWAQSSGRDLADVHSHAERIGLTKGPDFVRPDESIVRDIQKAEKRKRAVRKPL